MSPIDEQLRSALSARVDDVRLPPGLLPGVERRARRMRRQKLAAAVAGSALAVGALGLGGPLLVASLTAGSRTPAPSDLATAGPETLVPEPAPEVSPFALDLARPWAYRGDPGVLDDGLLAAATRAWQGRHPGSELVPLFGRVEPSGREELVFLGRGDPDAVDGLRWGVVTSADGRPVFVHDVDLFPTDRLGLAVALPGDEAPQLLVVAAPGTTVEYARSAEPLRPAAAVADGVGVAALEGDLTGDSYAVRGPDGTVLARLGAPDPVTGLPGPQQSPQSPAASTAPSPPSPPPSSSSSPTASPPPTAAPARAPSNVVTWPTRGRASSALVEEALTAFARDTGTTRAVVDGRLLYGSTREGRNLLLLSAWQQGQDARVYGYLEAAGNGSGFLSGRTPPGPAVLAVLVPAQAVFASSDWLLVVPEPAAGQVLYAPDGASEPQPVAGQGTEAAVVIDRAPGADGDRLLVLDGDGDPDRPIYRGTVAELLAGMR